MGSRVNRSKVWLGVTGLAKEADGQWLDVKKSLVKVFFCFLENLSNPSKLIEKSICIRFLV